MTELVTSFLLLVTSYLVQTTTVTNTRNIKTNDERNIFRDLESLQEGIDSNLLFRHFDLQ